MEGRLFRDQVSLGGLGPVEIVLGTIDEQSSNINPLQEVTGLMGMMPPFHDVEHREVFAQLVARGLCEPVFAMCLHAGNASHGTLTVGGIDERLGDGPLVYVPNVGQRPLSVPVGGIDPASPQSFYGVHVSKVSVGGTQFPFNTTAILDSGTNIVIAPSAMMPLLQQSMCQSSDLPHCRQLWQGQCFQLTQRQVMAYPPIQFDIGPLSIELFSRDYLLRGSPLAPTAEHYCLGIRDGGPLFLLGDTLLRNYYVVHDLGRRRIGWMRVNERTCGSLPEQRAAALLSIFV